MFQYFIKNKILCAGEKILDYVFEWTVNKSTELNDIHIFQGGNGRAGRLILNLELIRGGYPAINVKFADRRRYYDAFDSFHRDGKADDMVLLVAEYVNERLDRYLEIMRNKTTGIGD